MCTARPSISSLDPQTRQRHAPGAHAYLTVRGPLTGSVRDSRDKSVQKCMSFDNESRPVRAYSLIVEALLEQTDAQT